MLTNIICTMGPACNKLETLTRMVMSGMGTARLNFSHGTHEEKLQTIKLIRQVEKETLKQITILGDLQGPKIRLGSFQEGGITLENGQSFTLTTYPIPGDKTKSYIDYQKLPQDIVIGAKVLMNDGLVEGTVTTIGSDFVTLAIETGGPIGNHKGVNFPGTKLSIPALTEKDKKDLTFMVEQKLDYLACSFVREAKHADEVRSHIKDIDYRPQIIAKIETQEAVSNLREVIQAFDGIMVARGDLAVEVPLEMVPVIQKVTLKLCENYQKYSITATQMLESMINKPTPTRAEISDVANAVIDGSKAVMLSGESAVGEYPAEVVATMSRIIRTIEKAWDDGKIDLNDLVNPL